MKNIVLTLSVLSNLLLVAAMVLGLQIGDPAARAAQQAVSTHFLTGLGGLVFATFMHAVVLTYFMGTARWLEETSQAYRLADDYKQESRALKYQTLPAMVAVLLMLVATGAFGATADPASAVEFKPWKGVDGGTLHFAFAVSTLGMNLVLNVIEYLAIVRNGRLIQEVVDKVRKIRSDRGLPV